MYMWNKFKKQNISFIEDGAHICHFELKVFTDYELRMNTFLMILKYLGVTKGWN